MVVIDRRKCGPNSAILCDTVIFTSNTNKLFIQFWEVILLFFFLCKRCSQCKGQLNVEHNADQVENDHRLINFVDDQKGTATTSVTHPQ